MGLCGLIGIVVFYIVSCLILLAVIKPTYEPEEAPLYEKVLNYYTFPCFFIGLLIVSKILFREKIKFGDEFKPNDRYKDKG